MKATNLLPSPIAIPKPEPEPAPEPVKAAPRASIPERAPWVAPEWAKPLRASKPVPVGFAPGPEYWPAPPDRTRTRDGRMGVGATDDRRRWNHFLEAYPQVLHSIVAARLTAMEVGSLVERVIAGEIAKRATLPEVAEIWRHLAGVAPSRDPAHVRHRREVLNVLIGRVALGVSRPYLAELCGMGYGTVGKAKEATR